MGSDGIRPKPTPGGGDKGFNFSELEAIENQEAGQGFEDWMLENKESEAERQAEAKEELAEKEAQLKAAVQREEIQESVKLEEQTADTEEIEDELLLGEEGNEEQDAITSDEKKELEQRKEKGIGKKKLTEGEVGQMLEEEDVSLLDDNQLLINEQGEEEQLLEGDELLGQKEELTEEQTQLLAEKFGIDEKDLKNLSKISEEEETSYFDKLKPKAPEKKETPFELHKKKEIHKKPKPHEVFKPKTKRKVHKDESKPEAKKSEESKTTKMPVQNQSTQSQTNIAANVSQSQMSLETAGTHKGIKAGQEIKKENDKIYDLIAQEMLDAAKVVETGDKTETTITFNMPETMLSQGQLKVSAFKYRPCEVNLEFDNMSDKAGNLIKIKKEELKNHLKNNGIAVHLFDIR